MSISLEDISERKKIARRIERLQTKRIFQESRHSVSGRSGIFSGYCGVLTFLIREMNSPPHIESAARITRQMDGEIVLGIKGSFDDKKSAICQLDGNRRSIETFVIAK